MKILTILLAQTANTAWDKYKGLKPIGIVVLIIIGIIIVSYLYIQQMRLSKYPPGKGGTIKVVFRKARIIPSKKIIPHALLNKGIYQWRYARIKNCEQAPDKAHWQYEIEYYL